MAFVFMSRKAGFSMDFLRWKEVFSCEIESLCVVPRAPAAITSNGSTAHPRFLMSLIKF